MYTKLIVTILFISTCLFSSAQTLDTRFVTTDAAVSSTAVKGDTLFLGGGFKLVGPSHQGFAKFTRGSKVPDENFPVFSGTINMIESDGNGGLYLAGMFTNYNNTPLDGAGILHIMPDYSLDTSFKMVINGSGLSVKMVKKKGDILYACGDFTEVNSVKVKFLAAISATTGNYIDWQHDIPSEPVTAIEVTDSLVILLNGVSQLGNTYVPGNIAAVNINTGKINKSFPVFNGLVNDMLSYKDSLYLGGSFTVAGSNANGFAALSITDLKQNMSFPNVDGHINSVESDGSGGYYVGGYFNLIGTYKKSSFAHIFSNGSVDTLFDIKVEGEVYDIKRKNNFLYVVGAFMRIGGFSRVNAAQLDLSLGQVTTWNPGFTDGNVLAVVVSDSLVYLGGSFTKVGNKSRAYAAAFGSTGLNQWNPKISASVEAMMLNSSGTALYIGGYFLKVNSLDHKYIVKVDAYSGLPDSWTPSISYPVRSFALNNDNRIFAASNGINVFDTSLNAPVKIINANNTVKKLAISNGILYAGGYFTTINNVPRSRFAVFNLTDYSLDSGKAETDAPIYTVNVQNSSLFLGGEFKMIKNFDRNLLVSINLKSNSVTNWDIAAPWHSYDVVRKLIRTDKELFVYGTFDIQQDLVTVGKNLVALDISTGNTTRLFSYYPYNSGVNSMVIYNNQLVIGGGFTQLANVSGNILTANYTANFSLKNGKLSQTYQPNNFVSCLFINNRDLLLAGGFRLMNASKRNGLAAVSLSTGKLLNWDPLLTSQGQPGMVRDILVAGNTLFAGGYFNKVGSMKRINLAAIDITTQQALNWKWDVNSAVETIAYKDSTLYISGNFYQVGNQTRNNAAAISTKGTGTLTLWSPNPDSYFTTMQFVGDSIVVAGYHSFINGAYTGGINKLDLVTGKVSGWNPQPTGTVFSLVLSGKKMYVGGSFDDIAGKRRDNIAAFDVNTNQLLSYNPSMGNDPAIRSMDLWKDQLYAGGLNQTSIDGVQKGNFFSIDTLNAAGSSFNPLPAGSIHNLQVADNKLIASGDFISMGNVITSSSFAIFNLDSSVSRAKTIKQVTRVNTYLNQSLQKNLFTLSPNPAKAFSVLSLNKNVSDYTLQVLDLNGKVMYQQVGLNNITFVIPTANFKPGFYMVKVTTAQSYQTSKLLVQ